MLLRGAAVPAGLLALLVCGVLGLWHGNTVIARQQQALEASPRLQQEEHQRILAPLPPTANAGDQLYYLFFHTVREPAAWAPVAIGQRDVQAFNLKVRMLALQGQLYDSDLANPLLASFGRFDLAFVLVVLAPLLVIAVTFNVRSAEVEAGTWPLVESQPTSAWRVLATKYVLRTVVVWLPLLVLQAMATVWFGLPVDGRWFAVAAATGAYVAVWALAAVVVGRLGRSSDVNILALLGVWVVWTALGPAMVNVAAGVRFPMPEAMELTVLQRQGYHGAWDEPLPQVMHAFYAQYPQWRDTPVPEDRYSNAWYYAMQQRGDEMARDAAAAYRTQLEARDRWVARWSLLFPPAAFHNLLTRVARTDLRAYLAYLDSVAAYHESLKQYFFPAIFSDAPVSGVDWTRVPQHRHRD